jgi:hypothetical protein
MTKNQPDKKPNKTGAPLGNSNNFKETLSDMPDGRVVVNTRDIKTDDFKKEKDLIEYIVLNIDKFCQDILDDKLISFEKEYPLTPQLNKGRRKMADLYIVCENGRYLIEGKNPFYKAENRYAIGQLLDYGREYIDSKKGEVYLVLITTRYDLCTAKTIKYYNLPIKYVYIDKKRILELNDEQ